MHKRADYSARFSMTRLLKGGVMNPPISYDNEPTQADADRVNFPVSNTDLYNCAGDFHALTES